MRWMGHIARMGDRSGAYRVLVGKLERKNCFEDQGVNGTIISK